MLVITKNFTTGQVSVLDSEDEPTLAALNIIREMRWGHVKRHGRRGSRWYTLTPRNPSEWKRGHTVVDGYLATLAVGE